ncbi:MAG: hypothetical protein SFU56_09120 [Capsulimonadales bacterium]|nr:hypothetical protein [Capsulimonadales bacterium]
MIEILIGVTLMTLIFVGTLTLFASASGNGAKILAMTDAFRSSAEANQLVGDELKEAYYTALPDGSGGVPWPAADAGNASQYTSSTGRFTGIFLYKAANKPFTVAGGSTTFNTADRTASGLPYCLIYRGNADRTANADAGTCLWKRAMDGGSGYQLIAGNIAHSTDAVRFVRQNNLISSTRSIEVKIVTSEYGGLQGEQSGDVTGTNVNASNLVSQVGGRIVFSRNSPVGAVAVPTVPPTATPTPAGSPTPTPAGTPTPTPTPTPTLPPLVEGS